MNKQRNKLSFRDSRTSYSAENMKNTQLHRASQALYTFWIFLKKSQKVLRRSSHKHGALESRLTSARLGMSFQIFITNLTHGSNAIILR